MTDGKDWKDLWTFTVAVSVNESRNVMDGKRGKLTMYYLIQIEIYPI